MLFFSDFTPVKPKVPVVDHGSLAKKQSVESYMEPVSRTKTIDTGTVSNNYFVFLNVREP